MEAIIETKSIEDMGADTILATNAALETVRQAFDGQRDRPKPEWIRGICPQCGDDLISNCYYVGGRGYLVVWECWNSLGQDARGVPDEERTCRYRKVI